MSPYNDYSRNILLCLLTIVCILIKQVIQAGIIWSQCAELPVKLSVGKTTVINGKVYCGGGASCSQVDRNVYCYDMSNDNWTTLPPLPVRYFGLGQVSGKLRAVGGENSDGKQSNNLYTYNERSRKWKQTIPPMPTARYSTSVLSLQSALLVAGGDPSFATYTNAVEMFKPDTSQWYSTDPLPTDCCDISLTCIDNTCYAIGGFHYPSHLNQALYASVDDLLHNAVPANQTTHIGSSDTQSAWKKLPNTPTYRPSAGVLAGNLLTIGGTDMSEANSCAKKEVYMYSPSTNSWIYFSDLPEPRSHTAVAVLSSTEILVIGGKCGTGDRVSTVYKGTLQLTV